MFARKRRRLAEQSRLANPGFATQDKCAAAVFGSIDERPEELKLDISTQERRKAARNR
jgi:hypothetical protein